ncbi:DUF6192 family protein [Streptomyces mirabilis]|uniref:DUF6192 family protein n=1 Tax=Streptomyces mirabilis TaxID=68239 RepID=UPI003683AFE3
MSPVPEPPVRLETHAREPFAQAHRFYGTGEAATLGRLVPQLRGQEFTEDERDTVRRQIGRIRRRRTGSKGRSTTMSSPWTSSWSSYSKASRPCRDAGRLGRWPSTMATWSASP